MNGRLITVDLLALTSLNQVLFILEILFAYVTKQTTLMRRSTVLYLPLQLWFPWERTKGFSQPGQTTASGQGEQYTNNHGQTYANGTKPGRVWEYKQKWKAHYT